MRVALLVLLLGILGSPSESLAEKVKTNQPTKLYNRPGERGKVLLEVDEGKTMTVIAQQGRWLKVRVGGRTGFVPRSKVDMPEAEEIVRNTRRRSFVDGRGTKRGFNGEQAPEDRIGADAVGDAALGEDDTGEDDAGGDEDEPTGSSARSKPSRGGDGDDGGDEDEVADDRQTARVKRKVVAFNDPDEDSDESFKASPSTLLFPTGNTKRGFSEVENEEGDIGWVATSDLELEEAGGAGSGVGARQIDLRARIGVSFFQQGLRSVGGPKGVPDNYNLTTSAATIALGGSLLYPYKTRFLVGGELTYDYAMAIPGISVEGGGTTSVSLHNLRLRALGGYDLKKKSGMVLFARLGYHYQSYQVADVGNLAKNTATLPSEILQAPTIGAALAIPRLTDKIGLRFSLDAVLLGASLEQTKNLEDGQDPSARAVQVGAGMVYRWKKSFDLHVVYDLNLVKASFGAPLATSMRNHMGTDTTRTDYFHAVTIGIAKAL
ncbi:MAG: SH3 domain-containing protein [Kofleriaceae bacterium]